MAAIQPPANFAATPALDGQSIELTWSTVPTYTQFEIQRDGDTIGFTGALSFTDFDVIPEIEYSYKIRTYGVGTGSSAQTASVPQVFESDFSTPVTVIVQHVGVSQVFETDSVIGPITVIKGSVSGIQVPAPTGNSTTNFNNIQNVFNDAPDGSTINFPADAQYDILGSLRIARDKDQAGFTINGNNAFLNCVRPITEEFRHVLSFGASGTPKFIAHDMQINDLRLQAFTGSQAPAVGSHWGHSINVRNASHHLEFNNLEGLGGQGDAWELGEGNDIPQSPHDRTFNDCNAHGDYRRHCMCVSNGFNFFFNRCDFDKTGSGAGGTLVDIEPLGAAPHDFADNVIFDDCTFRWFSPNINRRSVQANGYNVSNVTIKNCQSIGAPLGFIINVNNKAPAFHDFIFTNNVSDPGSPITSGTGAMVAAFTCSFVTVTNNRASLGTGGSFTSFNSVTDTTVSGNINTS